MLNLKLRTGVLSFKVAESFLKLYPTMETNESYCKRTLYRVIFIEFILHTYMCVYTNILRILLLI